MTFSPSNPIVQLCLQGMAMEDQGKTTEAYTLFLQAWTEASNDFEKFIAAHYVARHQEKPADELRWLEAALQLGLKIDDDAVRSAFPAIYWKIARCHEALNDLKTASKYDALGKSAQENPTDKGPFYHGTKADLKVGDLLAAGGNSNYQADLKMNHIYFTALVDGAGLAAALAKGDGAERVYIIEPTGSFENDPNVTDKKFPGNPTRSYRSLDPLKIIGEAEEWARLTPADIQAWRDRLAKNTGEIIN